MDSFKVRRHKSAFCSVQLSVPDLLKDRIDNCPPYFQDKPLKWAAAKKQNTPHSIFVVLRIVRTSQVSIFPTVSQTHLINATSVTLGISVGAPVSNFNKFTAIENDAPGFLCNFFSFVNRDELLFLWRKRVVLYVWCSAYYQMLHNSRLQLPQRRKPFIGFTFNASLHMRSFFRWKIVLVFFCHQQVDSLESTSHRQSSLPVIRIIDHLHTNGPKQTNKKVVLHYQPVSPMIYQTLILLEHSFIWTTSIFWDRGRISFK